MISRSQRTFWILCGSLVLVLAIVIYSRSSQEADQTWPILRIGYLPIAAELPLFVAIEEGYFADEGIDYELVRFTSSNELGNAATADRVDIMAGTASNVIFDISATSGKHHRVFAVNPYSNRPDHVTDHMIVRKGSAITSLSQLAGHRIASFPGSVNRIFVNLILEKYGVPRDAYEYLEMPPPNWQPALESGSVDAVSALEPAATQIIHDQVGISIFPGFYADLMPEVPLSGHWIAEDYYHRADPQQLRGVLQAYQRAIHFCRNHEQQARPYLVQYASVREDIVQAVNLNPWKTVSEIDADHFQAYVDLLAEHGALLRRVVVQDFMLSELPSS